MTKTIDWALYQSFLAAFEAGSLSAAARQLNISQPTIGRHINSLEQKLGTALFVRSQDGLTATESARQLHPLAQHMAATAATMERTVANHGDELTGIARITASEMIGVEIMPPMLAEIRRQLPGVKIELQLSNTPQNLLKREADIAVRMFRPRQLQLVTRLLGQTELGFYTSREYAERRGLPASLAEMEHHDLIGFDRITDFIRKALAVLPSEVQPGLFSLRSDSDLAQLALIRSGAGIGVCQRTIAARDELIPVLPDDFSYPMEIWLTMHEDLRHNPLYTIVFDLLATGLKKHTRD